MPVFRVIAGALPNVVELGDGVLETARSTVGFAQFRPALHEVDVVFLQHP